MNSVLKLLLHLRSAVYIKWFLVRILFNHVSLLYFKGLFHLIFFTIVQLLLTFFDHWQEKNNNNIHLFNSLLINRWIHEPTLYSESGICTRIMNILSTYSVIFVAADAIVTLLSTLTFSVYIFTLLLLLPKPCCQV